MEGRKKRKNFRLLPSYYTRGFGSSAPPPVALTVQCLSEGCQRVEVGVALNPAHQPLSVNVRAAGTCLSPRPSEAVVG